MAWLNSTPEKRDENQKPTLTRREKYERVGSSLLAMPEFDKGEEYLLATWREIGMFGHGAMGAVPLTWSEIKAYCELTGVNLDVWEVGVIMRLSRAYVSMLSEAKNPDAEPPYITDEYLEKRKKAAQDAAKLREQKP